LKTTGAERRQHPRINVRHMEIPVDLCVEGWENAAPGILMDVSRSGLCILSFKRIPPMKNLRLRLDLDALQTGDIAARVVWVKQHENTFRIGLQFTAITARDYLHIMGLLRCS